MFWVNATLFANRRTCASFGRFVAPHTSGTAFCSISPVSTRSMSLEHEAMAYLAERRS